MKKLIMIILLLLLCSFLNADWIIYDEGPVVYYYPWLGSDYDCGWGVMIIAPENGHIDSAMTCFFHCGTDTIACFRIYDCINGEPGNILAELDSVYLTNWVPFGFWCKIFFDESLTHVMAGDTLFFFYIQINDTWEESPTIMADDDKHYPDYMWELDHGIFGYCPDTGDHCQRIRFVEDSGISEWIGYNKESDIELINNVIGQKIEIKYTLYNRTKLNIDLYDISGRHKGSILRKMQEKGTHYTSYNTRNLSSGIYFIRCESNDRIKNFKIIKM